MSNFLDKLNEAKAKLKVVKKEITDTIEQSKKELAASEAARKKFKDYQMKKLADSLKPYCRLDYIKSVGNGL